MSTPLLPITEAGCVRRGTHLRKGRTKSLVPGETAVRQLHYGRIILDGADQPLSFSSGGLETGLICLRGSGSIEAAGLRFELSKYDALYVPRSSVVTVTPGSGCFDLAEVAAPVEGEIIGLLPEAACERESEWMRQLSGFDEQTKILERRLEAPLAWPGRSRGFLPPRRSTPNRRGNGPSDTS